MADEIILKAPAIEQQVNITISGEAKLHDVAETLNYMSKGRNLQKFWKDKQQLFNELEDALTVYLNNRNEENAARFLKIANAYKAITNPAFGKLDQRYEDNILDAQNQITYPESLDCYSVICFKKAFSSFELLQAYGTDMERLFNHFNPHQN